MECKWSSSKKINHKKSPIKIYPEWNVNNDCRTSTNNEPCIKIYPEWNVNIFLFKQLVTTSVIKIYPEWNVNKTATEGDCYFVRLKSTQNGM